MIRNGKDIPSGTVVQTQVCIIGSGPAGITVAWLAEHLIGVLGKQGRGA